MYASGVGVMIAAKTKMIMTAGRQPLSIALAGSTPTRLSATRKTGSRNAPAEGDDELQHEVEVLRAVLEVVGALRA